MPTKIFNPFSWWAKHEQQFPNINFWQEIFWEL
jgi:hypothetical protein